MASEEETKPLANEATSSPPMELNEEERRLIKELRRKREKSLSKKLKADAELEDPQEWKNFLDALSAKKIEFMDLDPQHRDSIKYPSQAKADFLSVSVLTDNAQHFNPETNLLETINLSKKKPFEQTPLLLPEQEQEIIEAMKKYRQDTILPSFQAFTDACKQFYSSTIYESHYSQMKFDMQDSRLTMLEAGVSRKCFLLKGLPSSGYNKGNLTGTLAFGSRTMVSACMMLSPLPTTW